ncbi:MAG TPA: EutN/CcmL family microcompartment protein [Bacillota bacterium]|nr:EutN/CcmL family microcompartment protein [Bacillota bacterium]HPL53767.1 EutN/CcmL family microcompartment protein [Bacillota bacterium]
MIIGVVVGNVWATRKDERLNGLKLLVIKPIDYYMRGDYPTLIAADFIGAGIGETVLVTTGSSARKMLNKEDSPIDAAIVGIIDKTEEEKAVP